MVSFIIFGILIVALIIASPIIICKICKSRKLVKWQKIVLNSAVIGLGCLAGFACLVANEVNTATRLHEPEFSLNKNPKAARKYLEDIEINIVLPEFSVRSHHLQFTGGDDTEERWHVFFTEKLSDSFYASLDSLCQADPSRWRHDKHLVRSGMSSIEAELYIFSYWDPELIEIQETVIINRTMNEATLLHRKI